jgi:hypothetical protein
LLFLSKNHTVGVGLLERLIYAPPPTLLPISCCKQVRAQEAKALREGTNRSHWNVYAGSRLAHLPALQPMVQAEVGGRDGRLLAHARMATFPRSLQPSKSVHIPVPSRNLGHLISDLVALLGFQPTIHVEGGG